MINDLSRDPDRSIFGFSREVAREVTQPLWPSRVPLRINCSVMIAVGGSTGICKEESLSMVCTLIVWAVRLNFSASLGSPGLQVSLVKHESPINNTIRQVTCRKKYDAVCEPILLKIPERFLLLLQIASSEYSDTQHDNSNLVKNISALVLSTA